MRMNGKIKKDIPINQYISNDKIFGAIEIGLIIPVIPITAMILKIFDPIKLPIEIPDSFLYAATIEAVSSGADVPKATTVTPITASDIPIF